MSTTRRNFLTTSFVTGTSALAAGLAVTQPSLAAESHYGLIQPGSTILFQGDSITDAGRSRETAGTPNIASTMGGGYASMAAAHLLVDHADSELKIFNRGISGNKVPDLAARWDADCLALKPDVLSILIGVNDIWHKRNGNYQGTLESYETGYRELLKRTFDQLPDLKLVICEPFVLKSGAVDDSWFPEFDGYREVAKKIAEEFKAVFVPFQSHFDNAISFAEAKHWAGDGVHPSPFGSALMAHEWVRAVAHAKK
ncbi:SGNH/GDSL hydrolase family protein [Planctomicrobium sp. SH668]|uniref:SGNH/GDSL hydrolase family protein n=1 Tax=Planctomicrobium sp. SH668 TaxID=3448126 RepID=UPI003F5AF008